MIKINSKLNGEVFNISKYNMNALKTVLYNIYPFEENDVLELTFVDNDYNSLLSIDEILDKLNYLENDKTITTTIDLCSNIETSGNLNLKTLYNGLVDHLNNDENYFIAILNKIRYRGYNSTTDHEPITTYRIFTRKGIIKINKE